MHIKVKITIIYLILTFNLFGQEVNREYFPKDVIKNNKITSYTIYRETDNGIKPITRVDFDSLQREILTYHFESCFEYSEYDNKGLLISQWFFPFGCTLPFTEKYYKYNKNEKLTETIRKDYFSNISTCKNYYLENNLIKTQESDNSWTEYKYDSLGRLIQEFYFSDNKVVRSYHNIYDRNNNLMIDYSCDANGDTTNFRTYKYNEKNLRINLSAYDENNMLSQTYNYVYNEDNTIKFEEGYTEIENNVLKKESYVKFVYKYEYQPLMYIDNQFPTETLRPLIRQNNKDYVIDIKNKKIELIKSPFSIVFNNKKWDPNNLKLYSATIVFLSDYEIYNNIKVNTSVSSVSCLESGNLISGGHSPFESFQIGDVGYNLIYENQYSTKLNLLKSENGIYTLELPVINFSKNDKLIELKNLNENKLYLVFFIDRNLNRFIDENELFKCEINFY